MERVAMPWVSLPRYLVLDPASTLRFDLKLARAACEVDIELQNPRPGRAFLLLVGPRGGPLRQRMRLSGRARILFDARDDRRPILMLANPEKEPLVLFLRGRARRPKRHGAAGTGGRAIAGRARLAAARHRSRARVPASVPSEAVAGAPTVVAPVRWAPRRLRAKD